MDSKFSLEDIDDAAAGFMRFIKGHSVVAFHGEMGAGKTTFINAVCRQLQVTDTVSSPTFAIINQYKTMAGNILYHLDLYRIKNEEEAIMAGVEECLYSGHLCFVEWPEKFPALLPSGTVHCYLTASGKSERKLQIKL
jgi:tRNA threonylcarbamoyladenosine biosynthesis protein TsaE